MKRVLFAIISTFSGLVLLLSFKTHAVTTATAARAVVVQPVLPTATAAPATAATAGTTRTVTGSSVDTRWGPVQVQITVTGGKITSARAVAYPQGNSRDQEINSYAVPTLNAEAVAASSASIDMVSGATFTSQGYLSSLQSALDQL